MRRSPRHCWNWHRFNPRPREGSDRIIPTQELTTPEVSIRAPAKGAMCSVLLRCRALMCFNPRPREGSDCNCPCSTEYNTEFQSAPPRRERYAANGKQWPVKRFQSAPPRRERLVRPGRRADIRHGFQSAPPRRERYLPFQSGRTGHKVSIRAPAKGAIFVHGWPYSTGYVSIRAPAKGAIV